MAKSKIVEVYKHFDLDARRYGRLISKLNHPVNLQYMGGEMIFAPRQIENDIDRSRLGALPRGVIFQSY